MQNDNSVPVYMHAVWHCYPVVLRQTDHQSDPHVLLSPHCMLSLRHRGNWMRKIWSTER